MCANVTSEYGRVLRFFASVVSLPSAFSQSKFVSSLWQSHTNNQNNSLLRNPHRSPTVSYKVAITTSSLEGVLITVGGKRPIHKRVELPCVEHVKCPTFVNDLQLHLHALCENEILPQVVTGDARGDSCDWIAWNISTMWAKDHNVLRFRVSRGRNPPSHVTKHSLVSPSKWSRWLCFKILMKKTTTAFTRTANCYLLYVNICCLHADPPMKTIIGPLPPAAVSHQIGQINLVSLVNCIFICPKTPCSLRTLQDTAVITVFRKALMLLTMVLLLPTCFRKKAF